MLRKVLPPPGPPGVLTVSQLVNSVGDGAYYVCSVLYFTQIVGLSATQVGFGLTLGWGIGFIAGVPLGHLADRRGPRGTAILLAIGTGLSIASFLVIRSFAMFVVAACFYAFFQSGLQAVRQALLAALVEPGKRTAVRAYLQATVNAGLSLGAGLGGIALSVGTREAYLTVFAIDALSFVASALVLFRVPAVAPAPVVQGQPRLAVLRDKPYALISLLNMVMLLRMPIISLAIPLWVVQQTQAPEWMVAALMVLNTVAVMAFQVRVSRPVTDLLSASAIVRKSGWILLAACAVFALSGVGVPVWPAVVLLLVGASLLVAGEMMQSAGAWEMSFELAPPDKHGQYQGFFGSGIAVARTLGPLLLTSLVISWGAPGWLVLGGLFLASALATPPAVRWAARTRLPSPTTAAQPDPAAP